MSLEANFSAINKLTEQVLEGFPEVFLVSIKVKPTNNIKLFIDTDEGIKIDTCTKVNRQLYKAIEEAAIFPEGDFSLEVSSPGVSEPIVLTRQYKKNIGRSLEITLQDDRSLSGLLTGCTEDGIIIEETKGKGKKQEINTHSILFDDIKKAVVEIKF